ncbi:UNVERIFIED_CONTAM: hypothetical protein GTU68_019939 [Idotea baltica]|nr:hypothetical protein [Idotea baltica]
MLPNHSNFSGKIHGGHILNLMDQIAFACASKYSGNYCVTASVNQVDFLNPVEVGELLTMKASVNFTGNTSMVVGVRVEAQNIQTGAVKHCNSSHFTMVAKGEDGRKIAVPGLILDTKESIRRFTRSVRRKEIYKNQKRIFQDVEFEVKDFLNLLEGHNVKLEFNLDTL